MAVAALFVGAWCAQQPGSAQQAAVHFVNAAASSHLSFVLDNGATPEKYQIETMAGGVAVIDYNNDGLPDIYFTNGAHLPQMEKDSPRFFNRLFENKGNGLFDDVTGKAGVPGRGFCTGAAAGDYNNDGFQDLFVTCRPDNILYRNHGDGTFGEVTRKAGLPGPYQEGQKLWSITAGWLDYDNDGYLDLFISNYCNWSPDNNPYCGDRARGLRLYCDPRQFKGQPNSLFHNNRDGTFTDVSRQSGIASALGYGMGVAFADYNRDGYMDVFVANDTVRCLLFENQGGGRFREQALWKGVAYASNGETVSGMGADFRDFNNDGFPDLFVTALSSETWPLYLNRHGRDFRDITFESGVGTHSVGMSGWCNGIFDFDNDGWKDLLAVRSHVFDNSMAAIRKPYPEPNALFLNLTRERFRDASAEAGADFATPAARRGCAFADFDGNGTIDVVASVIGARAELFLNHPAREFNWIILRLVGKANNRDGLGAEVRIVEPSGRVQYNHVTTSVGYGSSSDRRVHFGLGKTERVDLIEVRWPSGLLQRLRNVPANHVMTIEENHADH